METLTTNYNLIKQGNGDNPGTWDIKLNQNFDTIDTTIKALDTAVVKKTGATLTGFLTLHAAPTLNLHPATKKYVDDKFAALGTISVVNTPNSIVKRDVSGNIFTNAITVFDKFYGNVQGNVTGSSGSCTGNAVTATRLATSRLIAGYSFDGTADIQLIYQPVTKEAWVKIIRGMVKFAGTGNPTIETGTGAYSIVRTGVGTYEITISNTPYTAIPTFVSQLSAFKDGVSPFSSADITAGKDFDLVYYPGSQNNTITVYSINRVSGTIVDLTDYHMSFIVVGK